MALAIYACDPAQSRGRQHTEAAALTRSDFQRDRDRVVHSSAFRRLVYKTQVFLNHEGDLFRTRLTHSLEVAQLGRSIGRSLGLCEDLVEAIALSHDLGHTPFGHAGQDALNNCMGRYGGFEHNLQSLRIVDVLEERYPDFDGLNLTFETREGILKHCSPKNARAIESAEAPYADAAGGVGKRFLAGPGQPSLEAQLCNLADEIAYNAHDIDDGVRSGLLTIGQLESVDLFGRFVRQARTSHPHLSDVSQDRRLLYESIRQMLSAQVYDVIGETGQRLRAAAPQHVRDVRELPAMVGFSPPMRLASSELKQFLMHNLYRHPQVVATMEQAQRIVRDLFAVYLERPDEMQPGFAARSNAIQAGSQDVSTRARVVTDFIAGMTDRFAIREHERITGLSLLA